MRTRIISNTTYYVRTTGNDTNNGLSPGAAWLTLAHAFDVLDNDIDVVIPGTGAITLDLGAGTFQGGFFSHNLSHFNGSTLTVQGNSIATTTVTDGFVFIQNCFVNITFTQMLFSGVNALASGAFLGCPPGAFFVATGCKFNMGATYNGIGCGESTGGFININNCEITGNGDFVLFGNGQIDTLTYTGTTSFVDAVMRIPFDGNAEDILGHTGTATGYKYTCEGTLWFPLGGGSIQAGVGSLNGIIGPGGRVFTGTDFHIKVCHTPDAGGVYNYQTPATGFSLTLTDTDYYTILNPAGTLAAGTITMSPAPLDGQRAEIRSSQAITALTFSPNSGQSVVGAPSAAAVGQVITAIYRTSNATWYF